MNKTLQYLWILIDYSLLLALFAFMPQNVGRYLASLRGALYYHFKRDWRSFTFGDYGLFDRTYAAYKEICTDISHDELLKLVKKRYIYQSIEEFESVRLRQNKFNDIDVTYVGLDKAKECIAKNPNAVFITAHFGSSLPGVTFLNVFKVPILGMSSNVTKGDKVHPSITKLYFNKYRAIAKHLNGGDVIDIEGNGKKFLNFLKKRGSLIIIADLPPNNPNEIPTWKTFFGKQRGFASGAQKLANSTNGNIIPFVCYYEGSSYIMKFGDFEKDPYTFLEEEIMKRPQMWWAADLLPLYQQKENNCEI